MSQHLAHATQATNLADILERVLDKGIVIAGDVKICVADIELLTIQIRLVICSVERAKEMGINWWQDAPFLHADSLKAIKMKKKIPTKNMSAAH